MLTNTLDRNALLDSLDATYAGGSVEVWDAAPPADADTAPAVGAVLINTVALPTPLFAAAAGGSVSFIAPPTDPANENSGVPRFVRMIAPGGARRQLTARMASAVDAGEEVVVSVTGDAAATQLTANQSVELNFTFTQP